MVVILLILTAVGVRAAAAQPTDPVHAYLGANASKAAIAGRDAQSSATTGPSSTSTFTTSAASSRGNLAAVAADPAPGGYRLVRLSAGDGRAGTVAGLLRRGGARCAARSGLGRDDGGAAEPSG